ncbi:RelA/SpoT domain-containing protein [Streptomyces griseorubiginosus]|uniref:GTP pyrophosphokinase n=1 Tax=Streptomyces griseorubiginosus TaxID=67304 RepID=UPI002E812FAC|nr:RelA/SpoT domain-containing protein [Streptomyces griseorubiginosus]WUB44011.1 RelA/SpoT domain-containing protein [Streptomyces griseorubiginosus]WUB52529.1 RelA/SpoT domain-containing protein [Streptomyces griseorubiginosus]
MEIVDQFIARYSKEYDFYSRAAQLVTQALERDLKESGVRCIVTYRAKDITRLEEKCRQRAPKKKYKTVEDIYEDIVDLAGVRIALYFPAEQDQVEKAVNRLFDLTEKKSFPESNRRSTGKEFSGYSATHYRVRLKERELIGPDTRYAKARVEVQVASVLMHAWSEVEHDLAYKPLSGDLSDAEKKILDQLNGLVIAGEMSLRMLQEASENRVARSGRFLNHYELAAYLLNQAGKILNEPVGDSGLGRVDLLFNFLSELKKEAPADLDPYLESLHDNVEKRPLSEQVIDTLLAEDPSRYEKFNLVRLHAVEDSLDPHSLSSRLHQEIGRFLTRWVELEEYLRNLLPQEESTRTVLPISRVLDRLPSLDTETRHDIDLLRRLRNNLVHGRNVPSPGYLASASDRLEEIIERVRRILP